jgi:raffinose/stachyose/melibiose transport system substrate-binding protein
VEATQVENQAFKTQIQVAISAGNAPDLFQTWGGGVLQSYVKAGVVREITALSGANAKTFLPAALSPSTFDGKHYAVPADLAAVFLYYNKDLFSQNKVELPTTWTKFLAACAAFKAAGVTPAAVGNKEKWPGMFWMDYLIDRTAGPQFFQKAAYNQASGGTFKDPAYIAAGAKIQDAVKAGCFEQGVNGGMDTDARLLLATGKAAMQVMGTWNLNALRQIDKDFTDKSLDVLPFPTLEDGKGDPADLVGGTGQAIAISAKAPPEADAALIEMLSSATFAKDEAAAALVPAAAGYDSLLAGDATASKMAKWIAAAPSLQLFYDQALPPKLVVVHLDTTQQLFGLATTPEQAAADLQTAAQKEAAGGS